MNNNLLCSELVSRIRKRALMYQEESIFMVTSAKEKGDQSEAPNDPRSIERAAARKNRSDALSSQINIENSTNLEELKESRLIELIEKAIFADPYSKIADASEIRRLAEEVFNSMLRLDVLESLIKDPDTTEIMVNGHERIFVEKNGRVSLTNLRFESRERLMDLIHSLVSRVNRVINESEPIVDARLEDGSRLNAVLPPVALDGPLLTIRRFPKMPLDVKKLIALNALSEDAAAFLELLVKARYNIFVCGGTGSGKTTFLNVLSSFIPKEERIITIEDSAELKLLGIQNLARMETRNPNTEGRGGISIKDLIRTSLRMRPDRIIVGEVRGDEAFDMLQAMNTGHDGSMSTGHANSSKDMMDRLESMVSMASNIPLQAVRKHISSAIEIVVFLQRQRDYSRRVAEVSEVVGYGDNGVELIPIFTLQELVCEDSYQGTKQEVGGSLVYTKIKLTRREKLYLRGVRSEF